MAQENVKWKKRQIFDKCFVEIAVFSRPLTFPADRAIIKTRGDARYEQAPPRGGNPTVATQHKTYWLERLALKTVSRLLAQTAHFFLSCVSRRYSTRDTMPAMEPNAPRTVKSIEVICIASPEMNFPRGLIHASIPLSRDGRQPSFTAHRLQRRKKLDSDGGLPRLLLYKQTGKCQTNSRFAEIPGFVSSASCWP